MYRWPLRLIDAEGAPTLDGDVVLEVPPRGAVLTLSALMHLGHPIHLSLLDAYLRGTVRFPEGGALGVDSRAVLANLIGPLVWQYYANVGRASLNDLVLQPSKRRTHGHARFRMLSPAGQAGRLACRSGLVPDDCRPPAPESLDHGWFTVISFLPTPQGLRDHHLHRRGPAPVLVMLREAGAPQRRTDGVRRGRPAASIGGSSPPFDPAAALEGMAAAWHLPHVDADLVPEPDGGSSLTLRPKDGAERDQAVVTTMRETAWLALERILNAKIEERRTESIALRLVGPRRTAELSIGWSLVLPRNRRVFAAWLSSDGCVLIRLSPTTARG